MKKTSILLLTLGLCFGAFAQDVQKEKESKDLRTDIRAKRVENHAAVKDATHGHFKDAKADHRVAVADKRAQKRNVSRLKRRGVKHPVARAKHQIHAQDEAAKYKN